MADEAEIEEELLQSLSSLLYRTVGLDHHSPDQNPACGLLFDSFPSELDSLNDLEIVLSGEFSLAPKKQLMAQISTLGGIPRDIPPTKRTSIILVGEKGSNQWATSLYGSKIEKALELRELGQELWILRETEFFATIASFEVPAYLNRIVDLPLPPKTDPQPLTGKTFVLTGTLSIERDEMKRLLEAKGAKVSGSVSAKTHYVVAGEGGGSKRDKAEKLGVLIIDEAEARRMME